MKIKTHKAHNTYSGNYFFILSVGNNAGKPLDQPCPNCFVLLADDETEKEFLYWICFGLWQAGFFRVFLKGSVIPFIRIDDLKLAICEARAKAETRRTDFLNSVDMLNKLSAHQQNITKQLQLIRQAKKMLMYKVLK